jgi:hypothetical protein
MAMIPNFGTDLSCTSDLDPQMVLTSGLNLLSQAIYRRLTTPRGCVIDDPNYGFDLQLLLNDEHTPADVGPMTQQIQSECLKDERVLQCTAQLVLATSGVLTITLLLTSALGPFKLVLAVSAVTVAILQAPP